MNVQLDTNNKTYTQDRELSWLKFNKRVLEESQDKDVPLLERLKFVSIFSSNLDEFYMIRVGRLNDLKKLKLSIKNDKSDMTPQEQLDAIFEKTKRLNDEKEKSYFEILDELKANGIYDVDIEALDKRWKKYVETFYRNKVQPILSPMIIDSQHPFPHLANKQLYIIVSLKEEEISKKIKKNKIGILPIPPSLPRVIYLEDDLEKGEEVRFVRIEEIVLSYIDNIFGQFITGDKAVISVTRNAELDLTEELEEDDGEDYRQYMKKILKKRARLMPIRLEVFGSIEEENNKFLLKKLKIEDNQVFRSTVPINLNYVFELSEKLNAERRKILCDEAFESQYPLNIDKKIRITDQVKNKDILLHYPYEQMDPFISLLKESANDPKVVSIKITMYRLAIRSKIAEQLCEAAENGKEVTVLMELKARFDEKNNIEWADRLEEAGCNLIYGLEDFKVHSKICLITRNDNNVINYITQIGTGNYNEKTACLYSDFSLITSNPEIGKDALEFFKNMMISNLNGHYRKLWIAPNLLKQNIINAIDKEIEKVRSGTNGRIIIKANSITERSIIDKLAEASTEGVKVDLIIRGICCIIPGIEGYTENIRVISLVGRFLEHHRVYLFGEGDDREIYISSADIMSRNLLRRVEIACPILDKDIKKTIEFMIDTIMQDNIKSRELLSDGRYIRKLREGEADINAQEKFIQHYKFKENKNSVETKEIVELSAYRRLINKIWRINKT